MITEAVPAPAEEQANEHADIEPVGGTRHSERQKFRSKRLEGYKCYISTQLLDKLFNLKN